MIRSPALLLGTATIVVSGGLFGLRSEEHRTADGPAQRSRAQALTAQTSTSAAALEALEEALVAAAATARRGAAQVVAGESDPANVLTTAAAQLRGHEGTADAAASALAALEGTARGVGEAWPEGLSARPFDGAALKTIAGQLAASAAAADRFASMRRRADETLEALSQVAQSLSAGDVASADRYLGSARTAMGELRAWDPGVSAYPVWLDAIERVFAASEALAAAVTKGDVIGEASAREALAAAAATSRQADAAFAVVVAEGGASVTSAPLQLLTSAVHATMDARRKVAMLFQPSSEPGS